MRVNVYAEEMTDRIEIIAKMIDGREFTGLRLYLELPATVNGQQYQGPFMHRPGDDDSSAVTFWGKRDLRVVLRKALGLLDDHYRVQGKPLAAHETRLSRAGDELTRLQGEFQANPNTALGAQLMDAEREHSAAYLEEREREIRAAIARVVLF